MENNSEVNVNPFDELINETEASLKVIYYSKFSI